MTWCWRTAVEAAGATVRGQLLVVTLLFIVHVRVAEAQSVADCDTQRPPAVGAALGRSSPYFEPSLGAGGAGTSGSVLARGGFQFAGWADLPIAGAWRARVAGGTTTWHLERQTYSADLRRVVATETVGHVDVREIVALAGRQGGRAPLCGYLLAGGGLYSLGYQDDRHFSPGFALTAGLEFPAGPRGGIQVEGQLHLIQTRGHYPIGSSTVVDGRFLVGWAYRF